MWTGMREMGRVGGVGSEGWRSKVRVEPAAPAAKVGAPRERICGWGHLVQGAEACWSGACPLAGARAQLQQRWRRQLRVQNIVFETQYCLLETIINNNQKQYCIIKTIYSFENNSKQYLKTILYTKTI